ncbi:Gmad2 immunoglobulin-like domain-containing protein [Streptomyces sp. AN091965]|uniref:Gmad2 immunoglobulin-like domain-containing protein n=1 Tax=Streptomyces sp. AN091965 TaxID=2927803 RepID=UPI0035A8211F
MTNRIDQPRRLDLVASTVHVGGIGTGHEATLQYRISDGHDEVAGHFTVGGGTGEHGQFQTPTRSCRSRCSASRWAPELPFGRRCDGGRTRADAVRAPPSRGAKGLRNEEPRPPGSGRDG